MSEDLHNKHEAILLPCKICGRRPQLDYYDNGWDEDQIIIKCKHSDEHWNTAVVSISKFVERYAGATEDAHKEVVENWNILNR